jgi:hypothetical protein
MFNCSLFSIGGGHGKHVNNKPSGAYVLEALKVFEGFLDIVKPPGFFKLGSCFNFFLETFNFFIYFVSIFFFKLPWPPCPALALPCLSPQTDKLQREVQGRPG